MTVSPYADRSVARWLLACWLCVALMVAVGGLTRLTESGLSIVEWKPVAGILPPMSEGAWQAEFAAYQASPQYLKINRGMSLEEFKGIFWLEYIHRLLGRGAGLVFFVPLAWFAVKRRLSWPLVRSLALIGVLGGVQGVIGWYMVASGLKDDPRVSHYRLALHLSAAFVIFGLLFWQWMRFSGWNRAPQRVGGWLWVMMAALSAQIILGALVAGLDAGLVYNTFPLMDGGWVPPELAKGVSLNEPGTVQWLHRLGAAAVIGLALAFGLIRVKAGVAGLRHYGLVLIALVLAQAGLGIATLLLAVPVLLASAHQVAALILFGFLLSGIYRFTQGLPAAKSVPGGDVHASLT